MTVTYVSEKCTTKSIVNTNEIIRAVLNFLFFNKKISHAQKSIKSTKKAPKSTKKHQKHKKAPKAQKRNQAKIQNANKQTKIKHALKKHVRGKQSLIRLFAFLCFLCAQRKENRNLRNEKSLQCNVLNTNVPINHFSKSS